MKLYAQHGSGPSDKITSALKQKVIDGAIIGAKDISPDNLEGSLAELRSIRDDADLLLDPQYYALQLPPNDDNRFGFLTDYSCWPKALRNEAFLRNQERVRDDVEAFLQYQDAIPLTHLVSPNIVVRRSLDSREGMISESFISLVGPVRNRIGSSKPVLATLAISREAIADKSEIERLAVSLTSMEDRPDGFYLLIAASGEDSSELYHSGIIANTLFLIYALKLNGFEVVWGYSDLLGTAAGIAGLDASASGWFSTLRTFSLNRFGPSRRGGQRPRARFFSMRLMNRVLLPELLVSLDYDSSLANQLPTDQPYFTGKGEVQEPAESEKCLQSWGALKALQDRFCAGANVEEKLERLRLHTEEAQAAYEALRSQGIQFETSSSGRHLPPIIEAVQLLLAQL